MDCPDHDVGIRLYEISGKYWSIHYTDLAITAVKPVQKAEFVGAA